MAEQIPGNTRLALAPVAMKGIKRTPNLIEAAALLAAEARRDCEPLLAAACRSEDIKEAQLAFIEKAQAHFVGRFRTSKSILQKRPSLYVRERDVLFGRMYAALRADGCNGCGLCEIVCTERAIAMVEGKPAAERAKCRPCNLCVLKCAPGALYLENFALLEELAEHFKDTEEVRSFREFMGKERISWWDLIRLPGKFKAWGLAA